ncbi:hypothetical protein J3Q64DRAFT_1777176 [Phycomyces blakesleeanus]|uniref:Uncharacterized protein n=1 Tax=Phycomyces blakesleeanus TaxID=4837 RepID=A0ABR3AIS6_PHYBL
MKQDQPDCSLADQTSTHTKEQQQHLSANGQQFTMADKAVLQLLTKLDEGAQTIANLRGILTLKTAELNELMAQLEITNQVVYDVECTTAQIETMLKEMGIADDLKPHSRETILMNAEASLDSAIKSANSLYASSASASIAGTGGASIDQDGNVNNFYRFSTGRRPSLASNHSTHSSNSGIEAEKRERTNYAPKYATKIRYKPDTKHILRQLNDLIFQLELDSGKFFEAVGTTTDVQVLQKVLIDLGIAKTIALSAKSHLKRRTILLRSGRRRNTEQIRLLGEKIRESEALWKAHAKDTPLLVDGKDIIAILDREDDLLAKNLPVHPDRVPFDIQGKQSPPPTSPSNSRTIRNSLSQTEMALMSRPGRPGHSRTPSLHGSTSTTDTSMLPVPVSTTTVATAVPMNVARSSPPPPLPPVPAVLSVTIMSNNNNNNSMLKSSTPTTPTAATTPTSTSTSTIGFSNAVSPAMFPLPKKVPISHRHSANARPGPLVKVATSTPRVRTNSLTIKTKDSQKQAQSSTNTSSTPTANYNNSNNSNNSNNNAYGLSAAATTGGNMNSAGNYSNIKSSKLAIASRPGLMSQYSQQSPLQSSIGSGSGPGLGSGSGSTITATAGTGTGIGIGTGTLSLSSSTTTGPAPIDSTASTALKKTGKAGQRGPGSTLRLRSMLARRNQPQAKLNDNDA